MRTFKEQQDAVNFSKRFIHIIKNLFEMFFYKSQNIPIKKVG